MSQEWDVIVVGGGPAGSTTAGYLSMWGHRVLLLEKQLFPRHQVGESLLPSLMPVLEDFGLLDEMKAAGFPRKTGGTFSWGSSDEPWDIIFKESPFLPSLYAYHVERAIFDKILLDHAVRRGAEVRQECTVRGVLQAEDGRVVGVTYTQSKDGPEHEVRARFVIDASGSRSVVGSKVTTRHYDEKMRQLAYYGYYRNVVGPQGIRAGHIYVLSGKKGWCWYIPMNSETLGEASVGVVTGAEFKEEVAAKGIEAFFEEALEGTPHMAELLGPNAERISDLRVVRDWAYHCERAAGPGYYLVGDSAVFLDPLLSTGVSLAMIAGYSASICIHTSMTEPDMEQPATEFYHSNYMRMFNVTRDFLHYFYSQNNHRDEFFWKARRLLTLEDNVGAKQAFAFFINTVPANPHPAVSKQITMWSKFLNNMEHQTEEIANSKFAHKLMNSMTYQSFSDLHDGLIPMVNGVYESSYRINGAEHRLERVQGVACDNERPVFSSTVSWLLGGNFFPVSDEAATLLDAADGIKSWGQIVTELSDAREDKAAATERWRGVLGELCADKFVLLCSTDAN